MIHLLKLLLEFPRIALFLATFPRRLGLIFPKLDIGSEISQIQTQLLRQLCANFLARQKISWKYFRLLGEHLKFMKSDNCFKHCLIYWKFYDIRIFSIYSYEMSHIYFIRLFKIYNSISLVTLSVSSNYIQRSWYKTWKNLSKYLNRIEQLLHKLIWNSSNKFRIQFQTLHSKFRCLSFNLF